MNQHLQTILNLIQQAEHFTDEEKTALLKAAKNADKELEITAFKLDRTEKVKRTTAILLEETIEELEHKRKAVEAQNRELEIEAALERVRTVAMGMSKQEDLLNISKIQFNELKQLGFTEIRNALIGIFHDDKNYFADYDYSDFSGGSITNIPYNKNPVIDRSLKQMKSATDAFTEFIVEGNELEEWKAFRKQNGEYDDARITDAVYYYFYSIEQGNVGISAFKKISDEQLNVLKKFRNVFDLAYKRYVDIANAEAQARESQIQLALERARTQSMIMQHSNELDDTLRVFHEQVLQLNIPSAFSFLWLPDENNNRHIFWAAWAENNSTVFKSKAVKYPLDRNEPATAQCLIDWKGNDPVVSYHVPPEGVKNYFAAWSELIAGVEQLKPEYFSDGLYYVEAFMKYGCFGVMVKNELQEDEKKILERFAIEFERAYTRFLDLQKAEAQARESQIQLALERVRARTMAMQHSDELKNAAALLFQQVKSLGAPAYSCGYNIWEKDDKEFTSWMSTQDGSIISGVPNIPLTEDANFIRYVESKQNGEPFFVLELRGKRMQEHYQYLKTIPAFKAFFDYTVSVGFDLPETQIHHLANFSQGNLLFITLGPCPEFHDVFKRFAAVFEQTYTRFLDLQKAEAQAREAQIEAALERVRSRSMGMQKSEELKGVIQVVHEQFVHLNINTEHTGFVMDYKGRDDYDIWIADQLGVPSHVTIPYFDCVYYNRFNEAKKKGEDFFATNLDFEEKNRFYKKIIEYVPGLPEETKEFLFSIPGLAGSTVLLENIGLYIENFSGIPFSDDENNILMRFGKVFQQTYTRFLDLQKAEAQAREAQIEAALERVRSRTIAMQRSEDLFAVIREVNAQLQLLNFRFDSADFLTDYSDNGYKIWVASVQESFAKPFYITASDNKISELLKETMEQGYNFFTFTLNQEEKNKYFDHVFQTPVAKDASDESKQFIYDAKGMAISCFVVKNIILSVSNFACIPYKDAENEIIRRFAFVFEQSYTRFLDLQKAEAQAREAQIETALEKVRSRSLAMHKSEELQEVVNTVFDKLKELNVDLYTAIIFIFKEGSKDVVWWLANKANQQYARILIPYADNHYLKNLFDAKEGGKDFFATTYSFEEKNELFHHLFEHTDFRYVPEPQKQFLLESELATMSVALAKNTGINITSYSRKSFSESDNEILKRFAKVFDQAYTRFLDLQKVETQAREAQVEAALERVRSRTTGMQKSEELREVIQTVFEQLRHLDFNIDSAHFNLNYKENEDYTLWSAAPGQPYPVKTYIPYFDHPVFITARQAKEKGLDFFTESYTQDEKNKFFEHLFKHAPVIPEERRKYILSTPGVAASTVLMNTISLWIINYAGIPYTEAENAILKRFGKIFEQSHTRFLDLQKAEAQAKEAIKRASVDRVRAEIASMRTTSDLERITPIIWNELTTLDVPFVRCGVFIMDEEKQLVETHLSTPDGEAIATFNLPYNTPGETAQILEHWYKKEMYKQHWNEAKFIEVTQNLLQQGAVTTGEKYLTEGHPADLYLHFLPFLQGMLYAGNTAPLNDDELQSMQNLADAFSTAYARYEDFNKLEEAKGKIETTLSELKATQHQLVQSEKMASLGELTAGIAHEIQNPLNFVNNFSEVSNEMIDELQDERQKAEGERDKALEDEIINDIKQNLEKINHHGKRADAIVKGMLQHSRKSEGKKELTDINALCDEYVRLSYHGLRAKDKSFNADFKTDFDEGIEKINMVPQDIGRVLLNLINNAFYAVNEKLAAQSSKLEADYKPLVLVQTKKLNDKVEITVSDNGNGIPQNIVDKIFQPFFTTKPTGQGTGLGLSLSYDIVKAHGGEIKVVSKDGEGSEFIIQLSVV